MDPKPQSSSTQTNMELIPVKVSEIQQLIDFVGNTLTYNEAKDVIEFLEVIKARKRLVQT